MKARADADYYTQERMAEANKMLLTTQYLELKKIEAVANNNKIYYGSSIPSVFLDASTVAQSIPSKTGGGSSTTEKGTGRKA